MKSFRGFKEYSIRIQYLIFLKQEAKFKVSAETMR